MKLFVLGAGFSKAYNPGRIPVTDDFLKIAEKEGYLKPDNEHKELIEFVKNFFGDYSSANIEKIASFLTTELIPDIDQRDVYQDKLYRQLISIVTDTLGLIQDYPEKEEFRDIYQRFANNIVKNETNIITFNYDLILDNFLHNTGAWTVQSNYGVEIPYDGKFLARGGDLKMQYLKLHGSLNWGRRIVPHPKYGDRIVMIPYPDVPILPISPIAHTGFSSKPSVAPMFYEPFVIPPIMTKESFYREPVLQNIWYNAKGLLSKAEEIFIIGYSFPPADYLAELLFRQSLATSSSESNKKIWIINPAGDVMGRVKEIFYNCECEHRSNDAIEFLKEYNEDVINES